MTHTIACPTQQIVITKTDKHKQKILKDILIFQQLTQSVIAGPATGGFEAAHIEQLVCSSKTTTKNIFFLIKNYFLFNIILRYTIPCIIMSRWNLGLLTSETFFQATYQSYQYQQCKWYKHILYPMPPKLQEPGFASPFSSLFLKSQKSFLGFVGRTPSLLLPSKQTLKHYKISFVTY